jgi:hypothetical protein
METPSQPEFDPNELNEDVSKMRTLWVNELVRLSLQRSTHYFPSRLMRD